MPLLYNFVVIQEHLNMVSGLTRVSVAIIAVKEDEGTLPFNPLDVLIVLEDDVVISSKSWVSSLVLLFGLLYALHISYPKKLIVFF
uniref:Uncharacterized protein n=1 Tax=Sinocyclocheilus rhinocerous TaxID=307959 RepID=A0A673JIC9_9TELE